MFSDLLERVVSRVHFANYVPPDMGKFQHTNRAYHGLVLNDPDVVRDYVFDDGKILHTEGNTLFYLPKGSNYRVVRISGHGGCYAINFDLSPQLSPAPFMLTLRSPESVRRTYREADRVWSAQSKVALTVAQRSVCDIILAGYEEEHRAYVPDDRAAQIAPAMEKIHTEFYKNELRISELAALCGMSEVYFRRIFRALHGKGPKEYMIGMRIERARQLLSDGGFSVREVAALCGYFEETHFSREFKRHVGCAPSNFIK